MTTADQAPSIPTARKVLCIVYGMIAVAGFILTWSQIHSVSYFLVTFWPDTKVNSASRFIAVEALMLSASAAILTIIEGRKHRVRWVWLYIAGAFVAASAAFPLFLIARELRMGGSETPRLRTVETILLAMLVCGLAGLSIWIDMG
jgi:Protein of unknown function DUF2834